MGEITVSNFSLTLGTSDQVYGASGFQARVLSRRRIKRMPRPLEIRQRREHVRLEAPKGAAKTRFYCVVVLPRATAIACEQRLV